MTPKLSQHKKLYYMQSKRVFLYLLIPAKYGFLLKDTDHSRLKVSNFLPMYSLSVDLKFILWRTLDRPRLFTKQHSTFQIKIHISGGYHKECFQSVFSFLKFTFQFCKFWINATKTSWIQIQEFKEKQY